MFNCILKNSVHAKSYFLNEETKFFLLAQDITYRVCQEKYHSLCAKALEFLLV